MTLYDVIRQLMSGFDLNVVTSPLYRMYESCMPSPRLWRVDTPLVMIILLLLSSLGFCTGLLHSYISGGLGSVTMIIIHHYNNVHVKPKFRNESLFIIMP